MERRSVLIGMGGVMLAGCTDSPSGENAVDEPTPEESTPTQSPEPDSPENIQGLVTESPYLKPISVEGYVERYTDGVRGVAQNISDRRLDYVGVDVFFYQDDTRVGDSLDNTTDLSPGTKWQFDAPHLGDEQWDSFVGVLDHRP